MTDPVIVPANSLLYFFLLPIPRRLTPSDRDIIRLPPRARCQECIDAYHKAYLLVSKFAGKGAPGKRLVSHLLPEIHTGLPPARKHIVPHLIEVVVS